MRRYDALPSVPAMPTAQTLSDAIAVLTPEPLDEAHEDWYVGNPTSTPGGHTVPPLGMLRAALGEEVML